MPAPTRPMRCWTCTEGTSLPLVSALDAVTALALRSEDTRRGPPSSSRLASASSSSSKAAEDGSILSPSGRSAFRRGNRPSRTASLYLDTTSLSMPALVAACARRGLGLCVNKPALSAVQRSLSPESYHAASLVSADGSLRGTASSQKSTPKGQLVLSWNAWRSSRIVVSGCTATVL